MLSTRAGFKSHGIREPLTNRIAGILDEYPDGTQIARELLQNSDDARSKVQWYLLDHRNHLNNNNNDANDRSVNRKLQLFHDDLSEYMGPALLAGNDSLFEDKDFKSMKNLAASEKRTDASKIGQMGIGFNSIYHLTDCPSFISGDQFMVIEPHERIFNGKRSEFAEGAVRGDFVGDQVGQKEFPDQLKAFSVIEDIDFTKPYLGTIFRFPLRTKKQAQTSLLSKYAYPAEKVLEMLMKLKDEALKGLLFLKHIERIVIYELKDTDNVPVKIFEVEIVNAEEVRKERLQLLKNLQDHVHPGPSASKEDILEYSIRPTFRITQGDESVREEAWQVTGFIGNVLSACEYMTERTDGNLSHHKLIPWVGIAAPLDPGVVVDSSRLFCFLPIGIQLPFPVHINGHFAVKHSRREIWTNQENDFSSQAAANIKSIWNVQLFEKHIPRVYATFLKNMSLDHGASYDLWPTSCGDGIGLESIWKDLLYNLLQIVYHEEQEVFFCGSEDKCDLRMGGSDSVHFAGRDLDGYPLLLDALDECVDLAVGVPDAILDALVDVIDSQESESVSIRDLILNPSYVRSILRQNKSVWTLDPCNETRIEMLKYCIQDDQVEQLTGLALLPLVGGSWVEFNNQHAHERFFVTQEVYNVLSEFNDDLVDITVPDLPIKEFTSDRRFRIYWSQMSPAVIAMRITTIFKEQCFKDGIVPGDCIAQPKGGFPTNKWIDAFWTMAHSLKDDSSALISMLKGIHLLPITGQRLAPLSTLSPAVYNDRALESACVVLDEQLDCWVLRQDAKIMVLMSVAKDYVVGASSAIRVLKILAKRPHDRLQGLPMEHRQTIADYMARYLTSSSDLKSSQIRVLSNLPIFQTYTDHQYVHLHEKEFGSMNWKVADRFSFSEYPWLPSSINLLAAKQPMALQLTDMLKTPLMKVSEYWYHVVSNLTEFLEDEWDTIIVKFCQSFHTLGNFYDFENILCVPFVRVAGSKDTQAVDASIAGTRLDPRSVMSPSLSVFFLDQEAVFPAGVYAQPSVIGVLSELGMRTTFDAEFVKHRIQALAKFGKDDDNMPHLRRVMASLYARLNGECSIDFLTEKLENELQTTAWILAKTESSDETQLCTPSQCRPASDFPLVGTQMPLSTFTFTNEYLLEAMGWNSPPPLDSVLAHLLTLIDQPSPSKLRSKPALEDTQLTLIYRYLLEKITDVKALSKIKKKLHSRAWILIDGSLYPVDRVALKLHRDLKPHFLQIPHSATLNALYLAMGVRKEVGQEDLQSIISMVGSKYDKDDRLSEEDAELVLKLLGAVADSPSVQWSPDLLVLTKNQQLHPIMDVVYDDVNALQDPSDLWGGVHDENLEYTFISSKISRHDAEKLQIPMFSAKCWQDRKESGFKTWAQKEDIVDRIRNVLNDYNPSSIVTEFLQNAADAGATKCVFMLDKRSFGETKVLSKQMAAWQGPALVIYNDAEFSEKDFEALSNLGVGSKREDTSKIGRHGLGFNSVYHFTDVPSVVSGAYIGFFDPQLTNLPKSHTVRGVVSEGGQRCDFRKLKGDALSDQLAPYKGLFGCDMVNHFKGTIFRIPLRDVDTSMRTGSSGLKDQAWTISAMQSLLRSWVEDAKVSMLFLSGMTMIEIKDGDTNSWSVTKRATTISDVANHVDITVSEAAPGTVTKSETQKWGVYTESELPLRSSEQIKKISHHNRWSAHRGIAIPLDTKPLQIQGRLFTHLPTPIATGLQFHIHGDFALMSNRKSLAGGSEEGNAMARWNQFIMVELLPRTLAVAFEHFLRWCFREHDIGGPKQAELGLTVQTYFKIWPTTPDKDVEDFIKSFWKQTCNSTVFPCRVNSMGSRESRIVGKKGSETVFPVNTYVPEEVSTRLYRSLQSAGINVCDCPFKIMKQIRATWNVGEVFTFKEIDVDLVRKRIRQDPAFIPSLKSAESKQWILKFVLKPLIDPELSVEEPLDDLAIIPMKNGEWKPFSVSTICYSADAASRGLIKGDNVLVDEDLFSTETLQPILRKLVATRASGVIDMTPTVFATVFDEEHPNGGTHDEWRDMWKMLEKYSDLGPFGEMLILKDTNGTMRPLKLCQRGLQTTGIKAKDTNNVFRLKNLLQDLGVVVFEAEQHRNHKYLLNSIAVCDGVRILNAIALGVAMAQEIRAITGDEADVLRILIYESEAAGRLDPSIARCLGTLPIWSSFGPKTGKNFPLIPAAGSLYRESDFRLEGLGVNADIINEPPTKATAKAFAKLGAWPLHIVNAFQERILPKFLNGTVRFVGVAKDSYIALLKDAIFIRKNKAVSTLLQRGRIIPARNGSFHTSEELFDPRDELTRDVFSGVRSKFPDQEVWTSILSTVQCFSFRSLRSSLASVLRECAEEVLRQIRDPSLEAPVVRERANSLVQHIYRNANTDINWMDPRWKIVPSMLAQGLPHSECVPQLSSYLSFSELTMNSNRDLCWTQCAFFPTTLEPSQAFKTKYPNVGRIQFGTIVEHLTTLVRDLAPRWTSMEQQLALKISLFRTYELCSQYAATSVTNMDAASRRLREIPVPFILNGDDKDPTQGELWLWPRQLMLDIDNNIERHQVVHKKLLPYRQFLVAAGVQQMQAVEGTVNVPKGRALGDLEKILTNCFETQDAHTGFMDVRFKFPRNKEIMAHKFILVHASEYFATRFTGAWATMTTRDADEPSVEVIDLSGQDEKYEVFWGLVYYLYTDRLIIMNGPPVFDAAEQDETSEDGDTAPETMGNNKNADDLANRVQYLMELQHVADQYMVSRLKDLIAFEIVVGQKAIHSNVFSVRVHAAQNQSRDLQEYCDKFILENRVSIRDYVQGEVAELRRILQIAEAEAETGAADAVAERIALREDIRELETNLNELESLA
ncbi:hypothetical protein BG011_002498 [Mortierella polycephala]|uniref:BTB domain-containing protein n=1 Tax=Mortierella polycephala TaxID=41804 RepID=A0A9P6Q368_9FUNG|nr:hypothetical protein BG011_002498 [Mortierella polycephala]